MGLREDRDYWRDLYFSSQRDREAVEAERLELKIKKMNLKPGDMAVVTAPGMMSLQTAERLKKFFEGFLPGVRVAIVADGVEVQETQDADAR